MVKAIWNNRIIAESDETIIIENNHYFPEKNVNKELLQKSETQTVCHWKGLASYWNVVVDGKTNKDAAWYYRNPKPLAKEIQNYVAFWRGVEIVKN